MQSKTISVKIPRLDEFKDRIFEGVIGQENPKREINFYVDGYIATRMIPHMMIIAPKGQGKTKIARSLAKALIQFDTADAQPIFVPSKLDPKLLLPKKKPFLEINCTSLKKGGLTAFVHGVLLKHIVDRDVTIFFDEASEIPKDVSFALLTILENNKDGRTTFTHDGLAMDFDFRRQSFIFATTESQKVFHALMDRCERITLQEYSQKDLADIIKINLPDIKIEESLLMDISTVLRGNARAAQKMSEKMLIYLKGDKIFTRKDWERLKAILTIVPLGLNAMELQVLRHLRENPQGSSLTAMSARTGMSREQLRQDSEMFLLKYGLMEITTTGRNLTSKGIQYLRHLEPQAQA